MRNLKSSLLKGWGKWDKVKGSGEQVSIHQRSVEAPRQAGSGDSHPGADEQQGRGQAVVGTRGRRVELGREQAKVETRAGAWGSVEDGHESFTRTGAWSSVEDGQESFTRAGAWSSIKDRQRSAPEG